MPYLEYEDDELGLRPGWDVDPDTGQRMPTHIREALRKSVVRQKENEDLKAELDGLKKAQAFQRAGVPNDVRGDMFSKSYDGPSDPDSVKAAFEAVFGKVEGSSEGASTATTSSASDAAARRVLDAGAANSSTGGGPGDVDFADGMKQAWAEGGNVGLKKFLDENRDVKFEYDGRTVGIQNPDID